MFKRRQVVAMCVGMLAAAWWPTRIECAEGEKNSELVLLIWPDYLDPELVKEFAASHKVMVRQVPFESDQERDQQVVRKGSDTFDLMVVNHLNLPIYAKQGWVTPLEKDKLRHLAHIDTRWLADVEQNDHLLGIPYFWGNIGLAYREDLVPNPPTTWLEFFRPEEPLRGHLNAMESDRELLGMALKALGHSVNSEENAHLAAAEALLVGQKPYVKSYRYIDLTKDSPLITGEVSVAMVYNGDAVKLSELHPRIRYIYPAEGSALWVDYLALGTTTPARRALALAFLDFLNDPVMAARNAQSLHFATPNREARRLSAPAYLTDPVIFPPEEILKRSEMIRPVAPRTLRRINDIAARLLR
ncbi:MAG: spermidine/putrescine ABC transporter substrate-binding protein [Magnetococcales bacterium]|nr:spermidine/putrescine ABC transporter substrate-binding protein [Magnetococcales bacterium]